MEHINQKELKEISRDISGKSVEIKIEGVITVEFAMDKVQCKYSQRSGTLFIYEKNTNKKFSVEIYMAYMLKTNENKKMLEIETDNEESITIHIM